VAAVADPEEQLAWEARQRPRAAAVAFAAAMLSLGGILWSGLSLRDLPRSYLLASMAQALKPGAIGTQPSLRTAEFQYYDDHAIAFIGTGVIRAVAFVAFAWVVTFLATATRARRPEMSRIVVYTALVGPVLAGIGALLGGVGTVVAVSRFLDGPHTVDAAREVSNDALLITATLLSQNLAPLLVAAGLLLVSLNAMRVGLLTRFLGILGMISGALAVLSQFVFVFVTTFWLVALALLFLERMPGGAPPAWRTGRPEPWPSQREVAESRRAARTRQQSAAEPAPAQHPSSKKRKRKRRT
jgi:uncharacterized Tic20 family protein